MKKILFHILIFVLITSGVSKAQTDAEKLAVDIKKEEHNHEFYVRICKKMFDPKQHNVSNVKDNNTIDGKKAYGIDGDVPRMEISTFLCYIDKQKIEVPPEIYSIFYEPNLIYHPYPQRYNESLSTYIDAFFGKDYNSVYVIMSGSDAAGSYQVIWVIRKDGNHDYCVIPWEELDFDYSDYNYDEKINK